MTTATFTEEEVSAYLDDPIVTDDHQPGCIDTAVRIISKFETDDPRRNEAMVYAAAESIMSWASDYGVVFDLVSWSNADQPDIDDDEPDDIPGGVVFDNT